ncbi:MAG: 2-hydroxyacid dehydrogenase [Prolixibacteraceae bacterium]|nr:2-hydroxyacid dehydrogenase [Prolixibacteraceae bacterium]
MKVAIFSTKPYDREFIEKANTTAGHEFSFFETSLRPTTVKLAGGHDAVCVFVNDVLSKEVIVSLSEIDVKAIVLRCAGFNNVDIEAACKNGFSVLRVPAYSPHAVAEHAVALIMTLNRKTHKAYNRVREGNFSIERLTGFELAGKTTGVIGTGKIGATFARIMKGFGCRVVAYDLYPDQELAGEGIYYLPLEEVFKQSDILSLHCPLTPDTHHVINKQCMKLMKKGVMLINTSRGQLIDSEAAIKALKKGQLGYLGIDVYEQEENLFFKDLSEVIIQDDKLMRLMTFPNVLITAHQAYFTDNALNQIAQITIQNLSDIENGQVNEKNRVCMDMVK